MTPRPTTACALFACLLLPLTACDDNAGAPKPVLSNPTGDETAHDHDHADHSHDHEGHDHADPNEHDDHDDHGGHDHAEGDHDDHDPTEIAVDIPDSVRTNLGITFIAAERRAVERTLRAPGRFEYLPTARREYRAMLPGRVELLVNQFDRVQPGDALYRVDAPEWREVQQRIAQAKSEIRVHSTTLTSFADLWAAHTAHEQSLTRTVEVWTERVTQLEDVREAGGGRTESLASARATLASARSDLAQLNETTANLKATQAQASTALDAAESRLAFLLGSAGAVVGLSAESLASPVETAAGPRPRWEMITTIEVTAVEPGVVETVGLTNGSWADQRSAVLTVVRPERLRFHASGLQSDLGVLADGLPARIVPPATTTAGRAVPMTDTMAGTLALGLAGDPSGRTLDLYVTPDALRPWARPGVSAQLEVVTDSSAPESVAIPRAAVQRDGLGTVVFRRDPDNPDRAVRTAVTLGPDDGRWVAVTDGLAESDTVVLDGAYQLMLATSGSAQKGGHFHADGTFHGEGHEEGQDEAHDEESEG